jgi:hypothetical protein
MSANGVQESDPEKEPEMEELTDRIRRRMESRYRRLCFVQQELANLDTAAGNLRAAPAESFEDFVFGQIDFSLYRKIEEEEFRLLFDEGLEDFSEGFYVKAFGMGREDVRKTINGAYLKIGPYRACKKAGPLILSIMRTLHASLEFAPLFCREELEDEKQYRGLIAALDGVEIRHHDGMITQLFAPGDGTGALCGTFHPQGKAYTIPLVSTPPAAAPAAQSSSRAPKS